MKRFEENKKVTGVGYTGEIVVEIVKRTAKTITHKSCFGIKTSKLRDFYNNKESFHFKAWVFTA